MKILLSLLNVAIAVILSATLFAQTRQTGYHTVACLKVKSDKGADFRKFILIFRMIRWFISIPEAARV